MSRHLCTLKLHSLSSTTLQESTTLGRTEVSREKQKIIASQVADFWQNLMDEDDNLDWAKQENDVEDLGAEPWPLITDVLHDSLPPLQDNADVMEVSHKPREEEAKKLKA